MRRFRSFSEPEKIRFDAEFLLEEKESHHLLNVRRAKTGDLVTVFDGRGNECEGRLERGDSGRFRIKFFQRRKIDRPARELILAQSLIKGKAMDSVVQKATELGVKEIIPVQTENGEVRLNPGRFEKKLKKWRSLTIEACKQSGNTYLPEMGALTSLERLCRAETSENTLKLLAGLSRKTIELQTILEKWRRSHSDKLPSRTICLIGPEGDFTESEYALAEKGGFRPFSLGPHVLRSETAALAALSMLNFALARVPSP